MGRRRKLLGLLRDKQIVSIREMANALRVSSSTVRRDLDYLSRNGQSARTHGGAIYLDPTGTTYEPNWREQSRVAQPEKQRIAKTAVTRIIPGSSLILDSSSTVLEVARLVVVHQIPLTVVTNDLTIASHLATSKFIRLIVTGGTVRSGSFTLIGEPADELLARLNVNLALIGVHAIRDGRISDTSLEIARTKRRVIESAERTIVVADQSKFDARAFCEIAPLTMVDEIITDERLPEAAVIRMEAEHGVHVTRC